MYILDCRFINFYKLYYLYYYIDLLINLFVKNLKKLILETKYLLF